jgi:hypothetical protein
MPFGLLSAAESGYEAMKYKALAAISLRGIRATTGP